MEEPLKQIRIKAPTAITNKVSAIKAIRTLTGLGLKESKDATERPGVQQYFAQTPGVTERDVEEQCRILRNEGFEVGPSVYLLIEELRQLGSQALLQGEDDLANEILQLVLAEKLRRVQL